MYKTILLLLFITGPLFGLAYDGFYPVLKIVDGDTILIDVHGSDTTIDLVYLAGGKKLKAAICHKGMSAEEFLKALLIDTNSKIGFWSPIEVDGELRELKENYYQADVLMLSKHHNTTLLDKSMYSDTQDPLGRDCKRELSIAALLVRNGYAKIGKLYLAHDQNLYRSYVPMKPMLKGATSVFGIRRAER